MINKIWNTWSGLKKNVKIGIIIIAIVVVVWILK